MIDRHDWALPVLAGLLLALAHPPVRLLVPAFVGLVPLLVFIDRQPDTPNGRWVATRAGMLTGALYFAAQLYWFAVALSRVSRLAVPAFLMTVLVLAALAGGFGWALHYTRRRLGLPIALLATAHWTALEWLQGHVGDLAFPWLGLGAALAPFPVLAGAADLVGSRGLTVWVAAANGLLAQALIRNRRGRPVRGTLVALLFLLAVPASYGALRARTLDVRPAARVAVVQPNIPAMGKSEPRPGPEESFNVLTRLTRGLEGPPPDLVIWPEAALPTVLADDPLRHAVQRLSDSMNVPLLVGAYGVDDARRVFNSAFLFRPGGTTADRYDKRRLVPFIERVPFLGTVTPAGAPSDGWLGVFEPGSSGPILSTAGDTRFGILICFESIFAHLAAGYRADGADFLVNMTNDAWYGRDRWWGRTTGLWQHPAHMVLRAIETRAGVVRAANTGISMLIDPLGHTHHETPLFAEAAFLGTVYTSDTTPLFVRWGDWLATPAALAALALLLAARLRSSAPWPEPAARSP